MSNQDHIHPIFDRLVSRKQKEKLLNQKSQVFWFTGLSGSGKSTIAEGVEKKLYEAGYLVQVLDGDNTRTGISNNLSFSIEDRAENVRRISEVSKLFVQSGIICLNSFVSPTNAIRAQSAEIIGVEDYNLIYVKASLEQCESRDVKGLYQKARAGIIKGFTGIDSPFDEPTSAALILDTNKLSVSEAVDNALAYIISKVQLA